jgi:hypothetical protein
MSGLKLLIEQPNYDIETLVIEEGPKKDRQMYFTGPYLMAEKENRNGRIYKIDEMTQEVNRYMTEMVKTGRSLGELNHPTSIEINPERSCHMITELRQDGNMFYGKSKILSTPTGQLVKSLMLDGVKLGVSSRALGKLTEDEGHKSVSEFRFICCDVVHDPSVTTAFVNGIYESKQWILQCDGTICEFVERQHDNLKKCMCNIPKHNSEDYKVQQVLKFIESLKGL